MKLFVIAALMVVAANAAPSDYAASGYASSGYKAPHIAITSQSDVRNVDGSTKWSYSGSDYTTREESQVQKKFQGATYDSYGKASYGDVIGNTNKGSSSWVSPEGEKFTLTWTAE